MNRFIVVILLLGILTSCQNLLTPVQVAELYWTAVQNKDVSSMKKYSTAFWDSETDKFSSLPDINSFELGQITINEKKSEIDTTLYLIGSEHESIQLTTYLIQTEGIWKVDHSKTVSGVQPKSFSDVIEDLSELSDLLKDEFNRSLDEIDKAIPEIEKGISEFEQKIEEGIPELQQEIDDLVKKLQELFELPEEKEKQETTTTEI